MGNKVVKCPTGFESSGPLMCAIPCPTEKGFTYQVQNGEPSCAYNGGEPRVPLKRLMGIMVEPTASSSATLADVRRIDPNLHSAYVAEQQRFNSEIAIAYEKIGLNSKVRDAFQALQDAENVRDQAPEAYQAARIRYYKLTKGDKWVDQERERIAKSEVDPAIQKYVNTQTTLETQAQQQARTMDIVNGVKDKVLSMRDELKYSVGAFSKQMEQVKNQIQLERRKEKEDTYGWIGTLLNVLLFVAFAFVLFRLFRRVTAPLVEPSIMRPY